jgi:hypothetical protein
MIVAAKIELYLDSILEKVGKKQPMTRIKQ